MAERVLIVDDHAHWRDLLRDIFLDLGLEPDVVADAAAARRLLEQHRYALVVLDVLLSGGMTADFQVLLSRIQRDHPELPVIAVTGGRPPLRDVFQLKERGVRELVLKPELQLEELRELVRTLVPGAPALPAPPAGRPAHDAFISYSRRDAGWVAGELLPRLEAAGLRLCIDVRDFRVGTLTVQELERCVLESRKTIAVLSPSYLESRWTELESVMTQTLDPAARDRRLLPVLLERCPLPPRFRALYYLDFSVRKTDGPTFDRLIEAIRPDQ